MSRRWLLRLVTAISLAVLLRAAYVEPLVELALLWSCDPVKLNCAPAELS